LEIKILPFAALIFDLFDEYQEVNKMTENKIITTKNVWLNTFYRPAVMNL
jgi:hypothetical protein